MNNSLGLVYEGMSPLLAFVFIPSFYSGAGLSPLAFPLKKREELKQWLNPSCIEILQKAWCGWRPGKKRMKEDRLCINNVLYPEPLCLLSFLLVAAFSFVTFLLAEQKKSKRME